MDDLELIRTYARDHSADAFATIVRRYVDLVFSTAQRRVHDAHLAEDVTQSVFLLLATKAGQLRDGTVLAGWLYQATRNVSRDVMRKQQRREKYEHASARPEVAVDPDSQWNEISPLLESGIDRLSSKERDAVLLRFFKGLSVQETAASLRIDDNAASKRIARGLEKLRGFLQSRGVTTPSSSALSIALSANAVGQAPPALLVAAQNVAATVGGKTAAAVAGKITLAHLVAGVGRTVLLAGVIAGGVAAYHALQPASRKVVVTTAPTPVVAQPPLPATRPQPIGPLEPISPQQERDIRVAPYHLRHYNVFVDSETWMSAARDLVQIGRPAVPELVAELDRTSNEATLRMVGFTLRAIGDARACPALIRAIARTDVNSGGYGFSTDGIRDVALMKFMGRNNLYPNQQSEFSSWPSIHEIAGALERITVHQQPHPLTIDARSNRPAELAAARQRHNALSARWQEWWDQHHNEFVTDAELASLTAHPHNEQTVESTGIAALGPLFPTDAPYHLGPIHDVYLHAQGGADSISLIDFDAERTISLLDVCLLTRAPVKKTATFFPALSGPDGAGVDAMCQTFVAAHNGRFYEISSVETATWLVANERWETLNEDLAAGRTIVPPDARMRGGFSYFDPVTDEKDMSNTVHTFLFRTREGGAGIIQTLGSDDAKLSAHFRYRMVQPHPKGFVAKVPATLPASAVFGPVAEVTLAMPAAGATCAFDLDAGKMLAAPTDISQRKYADLLTWLKPLSGDVQSEEFGDIKKPAGLRAREMVVISISRNAFDTLSPAVVIRAVEYFGVHDYSVIHQTLNDPSQSTCIFKTAEGAIGLLQLTATPDNPPSVRFRYKVVSQSSHAASPPAD